MPAPIPPAADATDAAAALKSPANHSRSMARSTDADRECAPHCCDGVGEFDSMDSAGDEAARRDDGDEACRI